MSYDIFQTLSNKQAEWVETAASLGDAKRRISELVRSFPGSYFIFDEENGCFIIPVDSAASTTRESRRPTIPESRASSTT